METIKDLSCNGERYLREKDVLKLIDEIYITEHTLEDFIEELKARIKG